MSTLYYTHADCQRHEMGPWHPESPDRLAAIGDHLLSLGLLPFLQEREAPLANHQALLRVHPASHIEYLEALSPTSGYHAVDPDTLMNPHTLQAALRAAGAAVAAVDAVIAGESSTAFCAVRPPGHHATPTQSMGFCFFNNIAVAARHALDYHGLERVAVIDFDVHHGNGTEAALAGDDRVLMCSFFQHPYYPNSGDQPLGENMVNVPVAAFTDGAAIRQVIEQTWLPRLHAHRPQMLLISAGFDAHREDELGQMRLVEADYAWITQVLVDVAAQHANGRIVSCLEGGYNTSALGRSVAAHIRVLAGL